GGRGGGGAGSAQALAGAGGRRRHGFSVQGGDAVGVVLHRRVHFVRDGGADGALSRGRPAAVRRGLGRGLFRARAEILPPTATGPPAGPLAGEGWQSLARSGSGFVQDSFNADTPIL